MIEKFLLYYGPKCEILRDTKETPDFSGEITNHKAFSAENFLIKSPAWQCSDSGTV